MTIDFKTIRKSEFPAAETAIHLKASGGSPMSLSAYRAGEAYLKEMCFEGDLYYEKYLDSMKDNINIMLEDHLEKVRLRVDYLKNR